MFRWPSGPVVHQNVDVWGPGGGAGLLVGVGAGPELSRPLLADAHGVPYPPPTSPLVFSDLFPAVLALSTLQDLLCPVPNAITFMTILCYGLKAVSPQTYVFKLLPQGEGVRRWGLWEVIGS